MIRVIEIVSDAFFEIFVFVGGLVSVRPLRHFCFAPFPFSEVFARCRTRQLDLHEDLHEKGTVLGNKMG